MMPTGPNLDVWVLNIVRGGDTRWTVDSGEDFHAVWRPDGGLAFATEIAGDGPALGWMASSSGPHESLFNIPGRGTFEGPLSWSPDGKSLVFMSVSDIYILDFDTREAKPFLNTNARENAAMVSPDGEWIAYVSDRTGSDEVYVLPFPGGGEPTPISTAGGTEPLWARDGRELYYRDGNELMVVTFGGGPNEPNPPETLFVDQFERTQFVGMPANYDVSHDGRFVMVRRKNPVTPTTVHVVLNWPEALEGNQ